MALVFYAGELQICLHHDSRRIGEALAQDLLATYLRTIPRARLGHESPAVRRRKRPDSKKEESAMENLAQISMWIVVGLIVAQAALLVGYVGFLFRFRRPAAG